MTFKEANQNTEEVKMNGIWYGLDKTMCKFSANVALDKATNGQTYTYIGYIYIYKTWNVVNAYLNVTLEDRFFKRSHPRKDRVWTILINKCNDQRISSTHKYRPYHLLSAQNTQHYVLEIMAINVWIWCICMCEAVTVPSLIMMTSIVSLPPSPPTQPHPWNQHRTGRCVCMICPRSTRRLTVPEAAIINELCEWIDECFQLTDQLYIDRQWPRYK